MSCQNQGVKKRQLHSHFDTTAYGLLDVEKKKPTIDVAHPAAIVPGGRIVYNHATECLARLAVTPIPKKSTKKEKKEKKGA